MIRDEAVVRLGMHAQHYRAAAASQVGPRFRDRGAHHVFTILSEERDLIDGDPANGFDAHGGPLGSTTRIPETSTTMTPKEPTPVDRQGLQIGDRVRIMTNAVKASVGIVGTISGFSTGSQHPLVEVAGRGRCLIPALSLVRQD
jgi:hypothetical protein